MIKTILDELNLNNSSNYKMDVLKKYKDNKLLQRVLKMTYDKVAFTYGITMKNISYDDKTVEMSLEEALDILESSYCTRKITGNAAIEGLSNTLSRLNKDDQVILEGVIKRDLRINMGRSNINKVFKNLITKPIYMRCDTYNKSNSKNISFPAIVQKKADGTYREFSSINGNTSVVSRSGEQYDYFEFERALSVVDGYFHGELTVRLDANLLSKILPDLEKLDKKNGTNNVQEIISEFSKCQEAGTEYILPRGLGNGLINSLDVPYDNLILDVWDLISIDDYSKAGLKDKKNLPIETYKERFNNLKEAIESINHPRIRVIEYKEIDSLKESLEFASMQMTNGFEGAILKDYNMVFKDGTSKGQLKLKLEIELEVRITGFTQGSGKNEDYFGAVTFENDEKTIQGRVGVSSMTEEVRDWFHANRENVVGNVMTVQCNDLTKARGNDFYALSHPRYIEYRGHEKDETDTLERAFQIREMAMELS